MNQVNRSNKVMGKRKRRSPLDRRHAENQQVMIVLFIFLMLIIAYVIFGCRSSKKEEGLPQLRLIPETSTVSRGLEPTLE